MGWAAGRLAQGPGVGCSTCCQTQQVEQPGCRDIAAPTGINVSTSIRCTPAPAPPGMDDPPCGRVALAGPPASLPGGPAPAVCDPSACSCPHPVLAPAPSSTCYCWRTCYRCCCCCVAITALPPAAVSPDAAAVAAQAIAADWLAAAASIAAPRRLLP